MFKFRENTASGKPKEALDISKETGAKNVGKVLGSGSQVTSMASGPGVCQTGYNTVGGKSGMQVKIPSIKDQSRSNSVPEPHKGESLQGFVSKYMGSKRARKDFPKQKQRAAVAYSEYKRAKK